MATSKDPGFSKFLEILAEKISRKAAVITVAMVLLYLLGASPTSPMLVFSSVAIGSLAVGVTILQWIQDMKKDHLIKKIKDDEENKDDFICKDK